MEKDRGITITNVDKQKQCDIHVVVDSACLCLRNGRGEQISGWCREHHTDWM